MDWFVSGKANWVFVRSEGLGGTIDGVGSGYRIHSGLRWSELWMSGLPAQQDFDGGCTCWRAGIWGFSNECRQSGN